MTDWIKGTILGAGLALVGACSQGQADEHEQHQTSDGRAAVTVDSDGYHPATIHAPAGKALKIVFTRTTDRSCGTEVVFPSLDIRRDLPLNRPVEVTVTPTAGTVSFTCGMSMYRGSIVAH
ncbi:MAG: cupredoxin domain-containing protein [Deltaproteobacteria bacterium]|nr:cupredoxin domain-containing protein [Deltaproteobacteria bacterium]